MSDYANLRELYYQALMVIEGTPPGDVMNQEQRAAAEKKVVEYQEKSAEAVAKKEEEERKKAEAKGAPPQTQSEWQAARTAEANQDLPAEPARPTPAPTPTPAPAPHPPAHAATADDKRK